MIPKPIVFAFFVGPLLHPFAADAKFGIEGRCELFAASALFEVVLSEDDSGKTVSLDYSRGRSDYTAAVFKLRQPLMKWSDPL